jgi:RNA polymerase-binding transcription factor DksA
MNEQDIQKFKKQLEEEKVALTEQLQGLGRQINDSGDWMATPDNDATEGDGFHADKNENADEVEDFQENIAILSELEQRYSHVVAALGRIEDGSYGNCKVSGEPIEMDRLEANPAAHTCKLHMEE